MKEWIVGRNPVYEVLRAGRRDVFRLLVATGTDEKRHLADALALAKQQGVPISWVGRDQLDSSHQNHQGVALEVGAYPYETMDDVLGMADSRGEPAFILILDTVQDPRNLGTLLRTAEIVGVHGVLLPLRRTATVTPAVVTTSSGASEHLLIAQTNLARAINELKKKRVWVFGLDGSSQAQSLPDVDLSGPVALVVGNEGSGLRSLVGKSCDVLLRLPMRGRIDSLNAAVAGSIALYFAWEARQFS